MSIKESQLSVAGLPATVPNCGSSQGALGRMAGAVLVGLAGLGILLAQLGSEWSLNPQYAYGWGVPFLGMILLAKRWRDRPAAEPNPSRRIVILAMASLVCWLPVRILREANMDWRLLEWMIAGGVTVAFWMALRWSGGTKYANHFAVPLLFLLVAVPWPTRIEVEIVQTLSLSVAKASVEALRWLGIAAWASGNLIQTPGSTIGIEDACSGIAALQGSIMCAIFIGEIRRLNWRGRVLLLLCGGVIACGLNLVRTVALALAAAKAGEAAASSWHDGAGISSLLVGFVLLWLLARFLQGGSAPVEIAARSQSSGGERFISLRCGAACLAWLLAVEAASESWYRFRGHPPTMARAELKRAGLESASISPRVRSILRFDRAEMYQRSPADGSAWWIYNLVWEPGGPGANLARYHSPEVCLPAAGFRLVESARPCAAGGLPFRRSQFEWLGQPVYVFSAFQSASGEPIRALEDFDLTWRKRIAAALRGERAGAQQVLQIVISGASSAKAAETAFREFVREAIVLNRPA